MKVKTRFPVMALLLAVVQIAIFCKVANSTDAVPAVGDPGVGEVLKKLTYIPDVVTCKLRGQLALLPGKFQKRDGYANALTRDVCFRYIHLFAQSSSFLS